MHYLDFEYKDGPVLRRYFWDVTCITPPGEKHLWWSDRDRKWATIEEHTDPHLSTHAPCRTVKAFKRMLRKHPHIIGRAVLVNKYIGYDVYSKRSLV